MIVLLATSALADPVPAADPRLSEYYGRRLRHNAELVERDWTVLQGGLALASRDFAVAVGDDDGVRRLNRTRRTWYGVAAATFGGALAVAAAATVPTLVRGDGTGPGPILLMVGAPGIVALPLVAIHLSARPNRAPVSAYYDEPAADALIEGYNRDLAAELSLDPSVLDAP